MDFLLEGQLAQLLDVAESRLVEAHGEALLEDSILDALGEVLASHPL